MISPFLKKTLCVSFLSHAAVFGVLGISFGVKLPPAGITRVCFWGELGPKPTATGAEGRGQGRGILSKSALFTLGSRKGEALRQYPIYVKPCAFLSAAEEKSTPKPFPTQGKQLRIRKGQVVMFYPPLPYQVSLYFRDRQAVHIELMFCVMKAAGEKRAIAIKRKVSSGNLEADLLSMRYISRYLFIQQAGFNPENWQVVKIDLSAK